MRRLSSYLLHAWREWRADRAARRIIRELCRTNGGHLTKGDVQQPVKL